jgi:hypothetical protein
MEHANTVHNNNETKSDSAMGLFETLTALPLECDILVMPEIPTSSSMDATSTSTSTHSQPDVLDIQAALNPCSISNLLLLQDIALQHKTSLLLSLSSCRLTYESQSLFVHPVPSTFAVIMEETDRQLLAELTVAFEFESAMTQWLELQDSNQTANQTMFPQASPSLQLQDAPALSDESPSPSSSSKGSSKPTRASKRNRRSKVNTSFGDWDMCFAPPPSPPMETPRSVQDPLILIRLQAMLDKEVEQMDQLLRVLAMAGAVLAVLLVWTAAQLYRANKEILEAQGHAMDSLCIPEPTLTRMATESRTRHESSSSIQEPTSVRSDWSEEAQFSSRETISTHLSEITVPARPDVLSPLSLDLIFQETEIRTPVISNRKNIPVNETPPQTPIASNRSKKELPATATVTPPQTPIASNRTNKSDGATPATTSPSSSEECAQVASSKLPPQIPAPPPLSIHDIEDPEESDFLLLIPKIAPLATSDSPPVSFSESRKQQTQETKIRSSNRKILDRIQAARQATATETVSLHGQLASFAFQKNDKPVQVEAAQESPLRDPIKAKANADKDESQVDTELKVGSHVHTEKVEVGQLTQPRRQIGRPTYPASPSLQDQLASFSFKKTNHATLHTDVAHVTPPKTERCWPTIPTPEAEVCEDEYRAFTNPAECVEVVPTCPLSPVTEPRENKKQNETQTLSPCSQLALEWAQKKSTRRNMRKPRKNTKIRPTGSPFMRLPPQLSRTQGIDLSISLSPAAPQDTASDSLVHETLIRQLPYMSTPAAPLISKSNAQPRKTIVSTIPAKPSAPGHDIPGLPTASVLACDSTEHNADSPIKETRRRLSPLVPSMLPELCSTPGSEDSFVDDYW